MTVQHSIRTAATASALNLGAVDHTELMAAEKMLHNGNSAIASPNFLSLPSVLTKYRPKDRGRMVTILTNGSCVAVYCANGVAAHQGLLQ